MSLLVWLPLHDGTLKNLGMSPVTFSISSDAGSSISSTAPGKTGQYSFSKVTAYSAGKITSNKNFYLPKDFSMACWCKPHTINTEIAQGVISNHGHTSGGGGITLKTVSTSECYACMTTGVSEEDRDYNKKYGTTNIYGAWHHLALTYNHEEQMYRLYVDGVEEVNYNRGNTACARPFNLFDWSVDYPGGTYRPGIQLNDVRLWDECISPTEVKLVS